MKTVVPAIKHLWSDLSPLAKALFAAVIGVFFLVFILLIITTVSESENRYYYRTKIVENGKKIELICSREPRLCDE